MSHRIPTPGADGEWIELPGLFDASEVAPDPSLEVRAQPLVVVGGRVLYGVYVRERDVAREGRAPVRPAA